MNGPAIAYADQIGGHGPGPIPLHDVPHAERLPWRAACGVRTITGLYHPPRRAELLASGRCRPCPACAKIAQR